MRITALEDQSLRCLAQFARHDGKLTIGQVAEAQGLSIENTAKILARLRTLGLIDSQRGKDGGYTLARPAGSISVAEVLLGLSGEMFETERCSGTDAGEPCIHQSDCGIRPIWHSLSQLVNSFLSSITLADLAGEEDPVRRRLERVVRSIDVSRFARGARLPSRPADAAEAAPGTSAPRRP